jgi:hypothetical protein
MNNSMLLVTSSWGPAKTFKMIPVDLNCPYNECIYDVQTKILAIISKASKQSLHMLPKLSDQGDVQYLKIGKRQNGKDYAEERKTLDTLYEYYIEEKEEIVKFVDMFAMNSEAFDITPYLEMNMDVKPTTAESGIITAI